MKKGADSTGKVMMHI